MDDGALWLRHRVAALAVQCLLHHLYARANGRIGDHIAREVSVNGSSRTGYEYEVRDEAQLTF